MTKRHRQLETQRLDLARRHKELADEAHAIGDRAEKEQRLQTEAERGRVAAILTELDDVTPRLKQVEAEIGDEEKLAAHERDAIARSAGSGFGEGGFRASDEFTGFGEFLQAVAVASDPLWRGRLGAARCDVLMNKLVSYQAAGTGMSVGVPGDGGFMVRKDWSTAMLDRATEQAQILPRCRNIPVGGDADGLEYPYIDETSRATGSRWGGVRVYWAAEAAAANASQPKIGRGELRLEEIVGLAYATERLMRDATALEGLLGNAFESEFGFKADDSIIRGTGAGQMTGFFSPGPCIVSVAKETNQAAATVVVANVLKMWARMPSRLKAGSVWLIHPDVMTQLPQMSIGNQPVWLPPGGLNQAPTGLLLGRPVLEVEQCEALGTQGDVFLANLNEYAVITKAGEGLRYDTSMHVRFLNREMAFRWVYRINGQPTWRSALTPFKGASTMSPFITLDTRA